MSGVCAGSLTCAPLAAQDDLRGPNAGDESTASQQVPEEHEAVVGSGGEIIVQADRLRGQLDVEQEPLLELSEEDIAAEGVASISDLITQITARTGSARGRGGGVRPIILVNGIRVGSFRELASYPSEALKKVEVFPEEVALRFGFGPDRRVINLILKDNYQSREVEFEFEGPSRGGYFVNEQEFGYLRITPEGRFSINLEANDTSLLTESERDIIQTEGSLSDLASDPDPAEFRSLVSDSRSLEANVSWAKAIIETGTTLSANVNYDRSDTRSLSGLNFVTLTDSGNNSVSRTFGEDSPLENRNSTDVFSSSGSLSKRVNAFQLTSTFDASLTESETEIDRPFDVSGLVQDAAAGLIAQDVELPSNADNGFDIAQSRTIAGETVTTLNGPLANLPGGELLATFDAGYSWTNLETSDTRTFAESDLTRGTFATGVNLTMPITSRRRGFADALGSFTLNAQIGLDHLSDFGTLGDYTVGLNWTPFDGIDLSATYIEREVAPDLSALGSPTITTFNVPVFDFTNGETVLATVTSGGNPDLLAETQRDWKFAANWDLPFWDNSRFTIEYIRNRSDDVTSAFPQITPDIEVAFPGRITRDANGVLTAVDQRFVTFAETRSDRLQFILSTRGSFGGGDPSGGRSGNRGAASDRPTPRAAPSGSAPSKERRAAFMAFREKLCADGGAAFLSRLIERVEAGEGLSEEIPGSNLQRMQSMLDRARGDDGSIDPERLAMIRERICSMNPAAMRRGSPVAGNNDQQSNPQNGSQRRRGGGSLIGAAFGGRGGGRQVWRYFANLTHTIELQNEILIAPGLAQLDQLDGDATSAFGFPRHSSRLEAGLFGNGIGARLSGQYTGTTRLNGSGLPGSSDLFFGDLATFDLRLFTNIDQLLGSESSLLKNLRVSFRADNLFDAQRRVVDESGATPVNYQPFVIDPTGRFVGVDIRKLF
ncbi:hypothetical protein AUC45_14945 [Erythrobacter sp. YT30]|nr:hypothetical protein AUC45_14945 [Erythrobacter sp. YT30]